MSRGYRRPFKTKPAVKSTRKQVKLGWGQTNKNINTLRKLLQCSYIENNYFNY